MNPFGLIKHDLRAEDVPNNPFSAFFGAAMDMMRASNEHQLTAERLQLDQAAGRIDDILTVQLAQDMAATSLNFTVQVTNRIIESYREIMRMPAHLSSGKSKMGRPNPRATNQTARGGGHCPACFFLYILFRVQNHIQTLYQRTGRQGNP
jgi:flagellar hook-basal body complex protein FliE